MAIVETSSQPVRMGSAETFRCWRKMVCIALLAAVTPLTGTSPAPVDEYEVKAAFIYNFAKFVAWPARAFKSPADPVAICILGDDPFNGALERAVSGKTVEGRAFTVQQFRETDMECDCQVLFVSSSGRKRFQSVAAGLKAAGVLIIGESMGFATEGGVINFKIESGKVRFEINVDAAEQQQLHISSKLLSLAQVVKK